MKGRSAVIVALNGLQLVGTSAFALLSAIWLGPSDRGVIILYTTFASLLMLIGSAGTATGGRFLLAKGDSRYSLRSHGRHMIRLGFSQCVFICVIAYPLLTLSHSWRGLWLAAIFAILAVSTIACYTGREGLHGTAHHSLAVGTDAITSLIPVGVLTLLKLQNDVTLLSATLALTSGSVVQLVILGGLVRRFSDGSQSSRLSVRELLRISFPALLGAVAQAIVIRGDRVILGVMTSSADVGIYGTAATISEAIWVVPLGLGQLVFSRAAAGEVSSVARLRRISLALSVTACAFVALLAPFLVDAVLGPAYDRAVVLIRLLCISSAAMSVYLIECAGLNGAGKFRLTALISGVGAVILVVMTTVLTHSVGIYGPVFATIGSYMIMGVLAYRFRVR